MSFRCILVCGACLTFLWSWASGFALGALSPRTVWITGPAFCLAGLRGVPYGIFGPTGMYRQWSGGPTDVLLAVLLQTALFWLPSIYGLCAGLKRDRAPLGAGLLPLALTAVAVGVVAWAGSWTWETAFDRLSAYAVLSWPLVYRVARGVRVSAKLPESPA